MTLEDIPVVRHTSLSSVWSNEFFFPARRIQVWLPSQYSWNENKDTAFSVLYCHDGQNAMQDADSWTGSSWRTAGASTGLTERDLLPSSSSSNNNDNDNDNDERLK